MTEGNDKYRDTLFHFIFGKEDNREWTLSLYNAVNGSSYTDPEQIQITTIREILYLGMHNDVSFILMGQMSLYEHQSTYNPNMPVRQLQYAANLYEKYIRENGLNKYSSRQLQLPVPKLVVFYNGTRDLPEETNLYLKDSFPENSDPDIDVRVRMININYGKGAKVLAACEPLREYSWLVDRIRTHRIKLSLDEAIDKAITQTPEEFILKKYLQIHKAEVKGMLWEEFDKEEYKRLFREEYVEEGIQIGIEKGLEKGMAKGQIKGRKLLLLQMISAKLKKGKAAEQIAEDLDMQIDEVEDLIELIQKHSELSLEELCMLEENKAV